MATLLDRLLVVAKDFEAERLQEQLAHQKATRGLEADLKSLRRTATFRADEISFLEQQLLEARAESEATAAELAEARAAAAAADADGHKSDAEQDMRKEIVCLRFEVARLRARNERLAERLDGGGKENGTPGVGNSAVAAAAAAAAEDDEDDKEPIVPDDALPRGGRGVSATSFLRAAARGDLPAVEDFLSPQCFCGDAYEAIVTSALTRVCAASATSSALAAGAGHAGESDTDTEEETVALSKRRVKMATMLIAEGALTLTTAAAGSSEDEDAGADEAAATAGQDTKTIKPKPKTSTANKKQGKSPAAPAAAHASAVGGAVAPCPLHLAAWSGDAGLVELLLAQPGAPLNLACAGTGSLVGTPLQLACATSRGNPVAVAKALLMAGADPDKATAAAATTTVAEGKTAPVSSDPAVAAVFEDCTVMFWNSSVRAFEAYSASDYSSALGIWGKALDFIARGKLPISGADKARLHYNRARALCHLKRRTDALEELEEALKLSPAYSNARTLQAESYFELYAFDKCLAALTALEQDDPDAVSTKPKLKTMRAKAQEQKGLSHYQVLGLAKGTNATDAEIKKAYRRASMKWHPDKHQQNKDALARANTTFKRLNEANQVLGDAYAKMMYDAELEVATASRYTNAHAKHDARQRAEAAERQKRYDEDKRREAASAAGFMRRRASASGSRAGTKAGAGASTAGARRHSSAGPGDNGIGGGGGGGGSGGGSSSSSSSSSRRYGADDSATYEERRRRRMEEMAELERMSMGDFEEEDYANYYSDDDDVADEEELLYTRRGGGRRGVGDSTDFEENLMHDSYDRGY